MKTRFINQIREYKKDHTDSDLFVQGKDERFCFVLEDVGRPMGVKIPANTCIPEGVYDVAITYSHRFKREMILLFNAEDQKVYRFGVEFTGVRAHGGNDVDDTEGCPLTAYNSDGNGTVYGRADRELQAIIKDWMDEGFQVKWVISSI